MGLDPVTMLAGSSVISGLLGSDAASSAADAQTQASNNAIGLQRDVFNQQKQLQAPYNQSGQAAMARLNYLLGLDPSGFNVPGLNQGSGANGAGPAVASTPASVPVDPAAQIFFNPDTQNSAPITAPVRPTPMVQSGYQISPNAAAQNAQIGNQQGGFGSLLKPFGMSDFQMDPGIQFQIQQGNQALQNSQAAKNGVLSGGALKDLIGFNQNMAGLGYQSAFDRYMANRASTYGSLMGMLGVGQSAASNTSANAGAMASNVGNTMQGIGNAQAAGTIGSANALSGGLSGASNGYFLSSLLNKGSTGGMDTAASLAQNNALSPSLILGNGTLTD